MTTSTVSQTLNCIYLLADLFCSFFVLEREMSKLEKKKTKPKSAHIVATAQPAQPTEASEEENALANPSNIDRLIQRINNSSVLTLGANDGIMDKILAFLEKGEWKYIDYKEGVCLNMAYYWKDWKSAKILLDKGANTGFTARTYHSIEYHWAGHPVYTSIRNGDGGNPEGLRMILERGGFKTIQYAFDIFFGSRYGHFSVGAVAKVATEFALKMAKDDIENSRIANSHIASHSNKRDKCDNPLLQSSRLFGYLIRNDEELATILVKGRNDILDLYSINGDLTLWNEEAVVAAFEKKNLDLIKLIFYYGADIRYEVRATLNGEAVSAVYALAVGNGKEYQHLLTAYQTFHARYDNPGIVIDASQHEQHKRWLNTVRELLSTGTDILQWLPLDKPVQWVNRFVLYHPDLAAAGAAEIEVDEDEDDKKLKSKFTNLLQKFSMQPTGFHVLLQLHLNGINLSGQVGWKEVLEPRLVEYIARVYGSLHPILLPPLIALSFSYF